MNKEQFTILLNELMEKIGDGPNSHKDVLTQIVKKYEAFEEFNEIFHDINGSMEAIRLILKYLLFDLEATRRERDKFRMLLEDRK